MRKRLIPIVLLSNRKLVKTTQFRKPKYVGDPRNVTRMFSDFRVDEMFIFDILATVEKKIIDFSYLEALASEAKMPLAYGGGVSPSNYKDFFKIGFEKIILNSQAYVSPELITKSAEEFGSQAVGVAIDVIEENGRYVCVSHGGRMKQDMEPEIWARECVKRGAGEITLNVVNREGTWKGLDVNLCQRVADSIEVPLVISGGMGDINDASEAFFIGGASAVAAGSFFVYQNKGKGVLINYPSDLER